MKSTVSPTMARSSRVAFPATSSHKIMQPVLAIFAALEIYIKTQACNAGISTRVRLSHVQKVSVGSGICERRPVRALLGSQGKVCSVRVSTTSPRPNAARYRILGGNPKSDVFSCEFARPNIFGATKMFSFGFRARLLILGAKRLDDQR